MIIEDLRSTLQRRLNRLNLAASRYGYSANPSIATESEDITKILRLLPRCIEVRGAGWDPNIDEDGEEAIKLASRLGIVIDKLE